MRTNRILAALLLLVAGLQTAWAQKMIVTLNDNSQVTYSILQVKEVTFVEADEPVNVEHEYVDLGLPSGTLWATCNVGASKPEEYGDYFAWGETTPKNTYNWSTYFDTDDGGSTFKKYNNNGDLTELLPEDDAATANWGSGWQMPSLAQIKELYNSSNTTTEWTQLNGVNGRKITSKSNGNSIFLPAAGYRYGTSLYYSSGSGDYWSRSLSTSYSSGAYGLYFYSGNIDWDNGSRCYGRSVRPVRFSSVQLVTGITLSETSITLQPDELKRLTATVEPADADNPAVTWTSSNEAVAEVNSTGRVTANANGTCTITCSATDGSGVKATCQVTVKKLDTMEYVDLGLPSGTLWATCNVGASKPEEYGDYFAWGETTPKSTYDWSTYKWCNGSETTMTKYCTDSELGYNGFTDNLTELQPEDDAATANWGSGWQMPSDDQIFELVHGGNYITKEWTQVNGVNGCKITSKRNRNSIFLPAAGYRDDTSLDDSSSSVNCWSRSLNTDNFIYDASSNYANIFWFDSDGFREGFSSRYVGKSVRPVRVLE